MQKINLMTHAFRKIASEDRDSTNKQLILMEIKENTIKLKNYASAYSDNHANLSFVPAMLHVLDWLTNYYEYRSGTATEWEIYAYYAYHAFSDFERVANQPD